MPATQLRAALGAAVLLLTILVGSPPAQATVIQVNTQNDNFLNNGDYTLREAIRAANNDAAVDACPAGAGSDVITLPRGTFTLFIFGTDDTDAAGDFDITSDVTIRGKGAGKSVVDGAGLDRVFHVPTGGSPTVRFVGLTIQDGDASFGGGIANSSSGVVTVQSSTITDNRGGQGGGLYNGNSGQLVVRDSTVTDNLGTAIAQNVGGGIINNGTLLVVNSTISDNRVPSGGGGGVENGGSATIRGSTINGNTAQLHGAGMDVFPTMTVTNSTVSGNSLTGTSGYGGAGIFNDGGDVTLKDVTVTGNDAQGSGGGGLETANLSGTASVANSILAGNKAGGGGPDCDGPIGSLGHNLIGNSTDCSATVSSDILDRAAKLGPLALNGGPTRTHALLAGSPAIDHGSTAAPGSSAGACAVLDQRGAPRQGRCDIGAYELVTCLGGRVNEVGTAGDDRMVGTSRAEVFIGKQGDDVIIGQGGNDRACGGNGQDSLKGGAGNDRLRGGAGNDSFNGGPGVDLCLQDGGHGPRTSCEQP